MLACALETADCPAACKDGTSESTPVEPGSRPEAAGDLDVGVTDKQSSVISIPTAGIITAGDIKLQSSSNDVNVYSITVERAGLGQRGAIDRLRVEQDGVRISSRASVSMEGIATITFSPALVIKKGGTENVDLVARFEGTEVAGEHYFRITGVDSSAKNISISPKETSTYRTTSYTVASVDFDAKGSTAVYRAGESNSFEFGAFRIDNKDAEKAIILKALTFRNGGDGDLSNLSNLAVYDIDGNKISKGDVRISGKEITFPLNGFEIAPAMGGMFYIRGGVTYVDSTNGDSYEFEIRNVEDLNAQEKSTEFRVTLTTNGKHTLAKYFVK
jgi:hypothetical protein